MQWKKEQGEDFTLEASQDNHAIRVEEMRAFRVWREKNCKGDNATTYQRNFSRYHRHYHYHHHSSSATFPRFMRIFTREQEGVELRLY